MIPGDANAEDYTDHYCGQSHRSCQARREDGERRELLMAAFEIWQQFHRHFSQWEIELSRQAYAASC